MPQANVSGGIVIVGSRTELPPGSSSITPVKPLQVNISGGSLTTLSAGHSVETATILNNQTVSADGSATLDIAYYQNLMLEVAYGPVVGSGSINISVRGFVPVVNLPGSTLIEGGWFGGPAITTQNIQSSETTTPLGKNVIVQWQVVGTVTDMYIFGEMVT